MAAMHVLPQTQYRDCNPHVGLLLVVACRLLRVLRTPMSEDSLTCYMKAGLVHLP